MIEKNMRTFSVDTHCVARIVADASEWGVGNATMEAWAEKKILNLFAPPEGTVIKGPYTFVNVEGDTLEMFVYYDMLTEVFKD